jgi:hypothetical protein
MPSQNKTSLPTPHHGETAGTPHSGPTPHANEDLVTYLYDGSLDAGPRTPHIDDLRVPSAATPHTGPSPHAARPNVVDNPPQSTQHDKAKRIGIIRKWRTIHAIGSTAASHNRKTAGRTGPNGGTYGRISLGEVSNLKRVTRREIQKSNAERRRIIGAKIVGLVSSNKDLSKRVKEHSQNRRKLISGDRSESLAFSGFATPKRIKNVSDKNISLRNANPETGDRIVVRRVGNRNVESVIPKKINDRSKSASKIPEIYGKKAKKPNELTIEEVPEYLRSDQAVMVIRDMRELLTKSLDEARREAAANGEAFDENGLRVQIMKNLTMGRYYDSVGGKEMKLRDQETAKILNRILRMKPKKFEVLFPEPTPRRLSRSRHNAARDLNDTVITEPTASLPAPVRRKRGVVTTPNRDAFTIRPESLHLVQNDEEMAELESNISTNNHDAAVKRRDKDNPGETEIVVVNGRPKKQLVKEIMAEVTENTITKEIENYIRKLSGLDSDAEVDPEDAILVRRVLTLRHQAKLDAEAARKAGRV